MDIDLDLLEKACNEFYSTCEEVLSGNFYSLKEPALKAEVYVLRLLKEIILLKNN